MSSRHLSWSTPFCLVIIALAFSLAAGPAPAAPPSTTTAPATAPATQGQAQRVHVFVSGKVQGVGFRAFVQQHAQRLKLTGFVRNLTDGRVELVAEGPANAVAELLAQVKQGPSTSRVDKLETTSEAPTGEFAKFETR